MNRASFPTAGLLRVALLRRGSGHSKSCGGIVTQGIVGFTGHVFVRRSCPCFLSCHWARFPQRRVPLTLASPLQMTQVRDFLGMLSTCFQQDPHHFLGGSRVRLLFSLLPTGSKIHAGHSESIGRNFSCSKFVIRLAWARESPASSLLGQPQVPIVSLLLSACLQPQPPTAGGISCARALLARLPTPQGSQDRWPTMPALFATAASQACALSKPSCPPQKNAQVQKQAAVREFRAHWLF